MRMVRAHGVWGRRMRSEGKLVLGSASPRRARLLSQLSVPFDVVPSSIAEVRAEREGAGEFAQRLAREKALAVSSDLPRLWVLGADTIVTLKKEVLGKPTDAADACRMLASLSGRTHRVITAVALVAPGGTLHEQISEESTVRFRRLASDEIQRYVATAEPLDKAGAYAIQGGAADFVSRLQGSYDNVVGLPLDQVRELLRRAGLYPAAREVRKGL